VDAVLITHSHVDHLNRWTLKAIDRDTLLVVPRGARPIVADLGFREVREAEPGDHVDLGGVDVVAVETKHDNGRWRKGDAPVCTGYVVRADSLAVHHAGDVDFSDHSVFDELGKRFDLAATLLPIGGMLPVAYYRWRRTAMDRGVHIDPDCALDIYQRLGARALVPIHWGTVNLRLSGSQGPRKRLEVQARRRRDRRRAHPRPRRGPAPGPRRRGPRDAVGLTGTARDRRRRAGRGDQVPGPRSCARWRVAARLQSCAPCDAPQRS
jgi:L-ascorbate metabolism protein UlaG (beta-lactamase superfamily)